jgi:hypothetical protein
VSGEAAEASERERRLDARGVPHCENAVELRLEGAVSIGGKYTWKEKMKRKEKSATKPSAEEPEYSNTPKVSQLQLLYKLSHKLYIYLF